MNAIIFGVRESNRTSAVAVIHLKLILVDGLIQTDSKSVGVDAGRLALAGRLYNICIMFV